MHLLARPQSGVVDLDRPARHCDELLGDRLDPDRCPHVQQQLPRPRVWVGTRQRLAILLSPGLLVSALTGTAQLKVSHPIVV